MSLFDIQLLCKILLWSAPDGKVCCLNGVSGASLARQISRAPKCQWDFAEVKLQIDLFEKTTLQEVQLTFPRCGLESCSARICQTSGARGIDVFLGVGTTQVL